MNVHDSAHQLARAIKQSDTCLRFKQAKERLEADPRASEMLKDFREKQMQVQRTRLAGLEVPEEQIRNLNNLFELINHNPLIAEYFKAEIAFAQVIADVQDILQQAFQEI